MTDVADLARFFAEEEPRLRRFLRRFGPAVSGDDIIQDCFARLCAADRASLISPRAYLFRIARNLALNELKRLKTRPIAAVRDIGRLELPSDAPSPEERLILADESARLRAALALLPAHQRIALTLFKGEGLSHKEIGRRLGVSHRTVERYVADALAHCHKTLSAETPKD
jgi:RNA polymerase sigma factor (sigma-70 family)